MMYSINSLVLTQLILRSISVFILFHQIGSAAVLDVGAGYTCLITSDHTVKCQGWWPRVGVEPPEAGRFSQVTVGYSHGCGIDVNDSTVTCWGRDTDGEIDTPTGKFSQISAGGFHTCGIRLDQTITCWGADKPETNYGQAISPTGTFIQVSAGRWYTCGIQTDGTVTCWGLNRYGETKPPPGRFTQISAAKLGWHTCGIKPDQTLVCWGLNDNEQSSPPIGTFSQVSAGKWYTCAIRTDDNTIACWGNDSHGQMTPPTGAFSYVSAGLFHTCGISTDNIPQCWGYSIGGSNGISKEDILQLNSEP